MESVREVAESVFINKEKCVLFAVKEVN